MEVVPPHTMDEYGFGLVHNLLLMVACGSIVCIFAVLLGYSYTLSSLIMGIVTGIIYMLLLHQQVDKGGKMSPERAIEYMKGGWVQRFCLVLSVVMIAIKLHQKVLPLLLGFFVYRIVIFINTVALTIREFSTDEAAARQAKTVGVRPPTKVNKEGKV